MTPCDYSGVADAIRVNYTAAVPLEARRSIRSSIITILGHYGLFHAEHHDKITGAWTVDATAYDPAILTRQRLTNSQLAATLRVAAETRGMTIDDLLAELANLV